MTKIAEYPTILPQQTKMVALVIACILVLGGLIVLAGWALDMPSLKSLPPYPVPMKANAAICFVLTGLALGLLSIQSFFSKMLTYSKPMIHFLAYMILFIAALTLLEYLFKINLGLDQWFFSDTSNSSDLYPGRMAISAAINFFLLAIAILFFDSLGEIAEHVSQSLAFTVWFIALTGILGHVFGEKILVSIFPGYNPLAFNAAVLFFLAAIGMFLVQSDRGIMATTLKDSPGGLVLRQTMPIFLLTILLLTWIVILGESTAVFNPVLAILFFALFEIFVFTILFFIAAKKINGIEIDPLTKLKNRRNLEKIFSHEMIRATRYQRPLSVLFIDIDDFKDFNDTYGHQKGDTVLVKLAETILAELRFTDYAFRYGGEEFVILLPETAGTAAFTLAERLRGKFKTINLSPNRHSVYKTLSIGIAELTEKLDIKEFIARSDKAMYRAKAEGKDQSRIWAGDNNNTEGK